MSRIRGLSKKKHFSLSVHGHNKNRTNRANSRENGTSCKAIQSQLHITSAKSDYTRAPLPWQPKALYSAIFEQTAHYRWRRFTLERAGLFCFVVLKYSLLFLERESTVLAPDFNKQLMTSTQNHITSSKTSQRNNDNKK